MRLGRLFLCFVTIFASDGVSETEVSISGIYWQVELAVLAHGVLWNNKYLFTLSLGFILVGNVVRFVFWLKYLMVKKRMGETYDYAGFWDEWERMSTREEMEKVNQYLKEYEKGIKNNEKHKK